MIEVNLLPEDRRPVERTPLPRFLAIIAGVIGFSVEGILLVMMVLAIPRKQQNLTDVELRITNAQKNLTQIEEYEDRIEEVKARKRQIDNLDRHRRIWAPLLHRLSASDVLPANIWYREVELKAGKAARGKTAPKELYLRGYARGNAGSSEEGNVNAMFQAAQAIRDFVGKLKKDKNFAEEFTGVPVPIEAVEITELSKPKGASPNVPQHAAAFGYKLVLKEKKSSAASAAKDRN